MACCRNMDPVDPDDLPKQIFDGSPALKYELVEEPRHITQFVEVKRATLTWTELKDHLRAGIKLPGILRIEMEFETEYTDAPSGIAIYYDEKVPKKPDTSGPYMPA